MPATINAALGGRVVPSHEPHRSLPGGFGETESRVARVRGIEP